MKIIKKISEMRATCVEVRKANRIGFVPTMGALHTAHLKLVDTAKSKADFIVVSIFVNPLQFGVFGEDFKTYPRNLECAAQLLENMGVDVLFTPSAEEMYPPGYDTYVKVAGFSSLLCGSSRPGHFKGVCTVVCKLFNIISPDIAVFGEKDAQQVIIIKKMVEELNMGVQLLTIPTIRETDGLAMSSRNIYLSPQERKDAVVMYQSLLMAKDLIEKGERSACKIKDKMRALISSKPTAKIDYIDIVRTNDLSPLETLDGEVLIASAVQFGKARLIDNITINKDFLDRL